MTTRRTARWMATPLAAALLLAPASGAFAQDGDTQTAEDTTVVTEESVSDAAAALQVLEAQLTDLALTLAGLGDEDTEARANVEALLAAAADEISLGVIVISAKADRDEDGDIDDDEAEALVASLEDDEDDDADSGHGDLVRQVATCAPRGQQTVGFLGGLKNHGKWVSAAAHGDTVEMAIPDLSTGVVEGDDGELTLTSTVVSFDLSDPQAVADLCSAFAVLAQANELLAEANGEDLPRKNGQKNDAKKAEKAEAKDQRKADRDEAKAERDAAKADRKAGKAGDDSDDDGDDSDDDGDESDDD